MHTTIIGTDHPFSAQKQFLHKVEEEISSTVDLLKAIQHYQNYLNYASSKLYGLGYDLHLVPSDMELHIDDVKGYSDLLLQLTPDMQLGHNHNVNAKVTPPLSSPQ